MTGPSRVLVALVALTAVVSPVAGGVAAPTAAADGDPAFTSTAFQAEQGETATIEIDVAAAGDAVDLTIGDADAVNFEVRATAEDADGDGTITVDLDTGAAGDGDAASYLDAGADELADASQVTDDFDGGLDPAGYDLRLGDRDAPADNATLSVHASDDGSGDESDGSQGESETSAQSEYDVEASAVTAGEVATVDVTLPADGSARLTVGDADAVNFEAVATVTDADSDGVATVEVDTAAAGDGDADAYLSAAGDDAVTDATQRTDAFDGGLDPAEYDLALSADGERVATGFLSVEAPPTTDDTDNESVDVTFDDEGEEITLEAADRQVVTGETSLEPGTEAAVRIRLADGSDRFRAHRLVTVRDDGSFRAPFDLSGVGENLSVAVVFVHDERELATAPGRIVACEADCLRTDTVRVLAPVEAAQNGTAEIPVTFGPSDRLDVSIAAIDGAYEVNATVEDADGDGRATLQFRPAAAHTDEPTLLVAEGGETREATITGESDRATPLPAGNYNLRAEAPAVDDEWDTGLVIVFEGDAASGGDDPAGADTEDDGDANDGDDASGETPDPLQVQAGSTGGLPLAPVGALGIGGLLAVAGFARLLRS